jgi:large subunit ribosomal protein L18
MPSRQVRRLRTIKKLSYDRPVLLLTRSNKNIQAQVLDMKTGRTLCTFNSNKIKGKTKTEKSVEVGKQIAQYLKSNKIESVVFNRNGYLYHGRVAALVEAVRQENIII